MEAMIANPHEDLIAKVVGAEGNLEALAPEERKEYYLALCQRLGLDPLTLPFYILKTREGKVRLYLNRGGAEALRRVHNISLTVLQSEVSGGLYRVVVEARLPDGRWEQAVGVADVRYKSGEELENAIYTAETKAKRRATISLLGLGALLLDETEVLSMAGVSLGRIDVETGTMEFSEANPRVYPTAKRGITKEQAERFVGLFRDLGLHRKEVNREIVSLFVGRPVESMRDLSYEEAEELLGEFQALKEKGLDRIGTLEALGGLLLERGAPLEKVEELKALLIF